MRTTSNTKRNTALQLLEDGSVWTMSGLREKGVTVRVMRGLVSDGLVTCPAHGVYQAAHASPGAYDEWSQVAARVPGCVFVLTSAALFHGITQEMPAAIQIGIPMSKGHPPRMGGDFFTPIEALRWRRSQDMEIGVDVHRVNGVDLRITSQERTVIDLWRYSTLNESLPRHMRRITPETFYDAFARYMTPGVGNADPALMAKTANELGVGGAIGTLIEYEAAQPRQP